MTEASKNYRLFKVAKELNTGSSTLVGHLVSKGFDLKDSPNEKLTDEMYNVLMRDFASEKVLKQKAEQIKEAKQEQRHGRREEHEHDEEEQILSARDLKSGVLEGREKTVAPKNELKPRVQPQPEKQEEKPEPPVRQPETNVPGLKIIDKIDLSQFDRKRGGKPEQRQGDKRGPEQPHQRPQHQQHQNQNQNQQRPDQRPQHEKQRPAVEEQRKPVEHPRHEKPVERPVVENKPPVKQPEEQEKPVVERPAAEVKPPVVETPSKPAVETPPVNETPDAPKEQEVVRAADHAPRLSGLNILGHIDLSGTRNRSKLKSKDNESNTPPSTNQGGSGAAGGPGAESEEAKRKRKRKRKRNKTGGTTPGQPGQQGQGGPNQGGQQGQGGGQQGQGGNKGPIQRDPKTGRPILSSGPKKNEPTQRELNDQVRSTLADMRKGASRSRQGMRKDKRTSHRERREAEYLREQEQATVLEVTEFLSANELANMMNVPVTEIITKCMQIGQFVSINQRLDSELITLLAEDYGYSVEFVDLADKAFEEAEDVVDAEEDLEHRAPIVTVMGHVDHGKTSLLDYIRKANVIAGEAGGITQHIGAYEVALEDGRKICFLDTPGHEAFTAMRARGAKVTDLAIIVVAADDNVMPQTKEAINHAQAAGVPMVFALNKIDKPTADADRIRRQLSEYNIVLEEWGGKFQSQEISAKSGLGIPELLDKVLLEAEMLELKANPDKPAKGTVIEARVDKGRGTVATVLVQDGTLKVGDSLVAGVNHGRVRALMDERGKRIKSAGPSTPVQLLGLTGTPTAGDRFVVYEDERKSKEVAHRRAELFREQSLRQQKRLTLEEVARRNARGEFKELKIIVKGDVDGSVEALSDSLLRLTFDEVQVNVIRKAVGQISEADVLLATASDAIIIGFQVRPSIGARKLAETEGIDIRMYSVIYDAINDVKDALEGLLSPELKEEITGTAEIREVFKITKVGSVAGCMVLDGTMNRKDPIRIIREGIVIYTGHLASLKRFKDDAREVNKGFECGMQVQGYNDIQERDLIEQFRTTEVQRKLK